MPEIKVGEYLFRRLRELGVKTIFGVPGGKHSLSISDPPIVFY
jgi:TPP-dependent 2-oxoacid decarboxylase